ncbi:MAG: carotenoid biosynthesis protein [Bacteroidales bacterium]|nr:carotenoid biosynthesis protein [Bacteroidales bacterium]MBN2763183.1 carotenoid biosynthesis protein [Bacteroidales bacterium]
MKTNGKIEKKLLLIVVLLFSVGFVLHVVPALRQKALILTEGFLFIINTFVFVAFIRNHFSWSLLMITFLILLLTFFIEVMGVKTGLIFGSYAYGDVFNITLFNVPLVIGFNWLMLILSANSLVKYWLRHRWIFTALLAAVLVLILDVLLEPVAITLGYWSWESHSVPIRNYMAWFVIGACFSFILKSYDLKSSILKYYIIIQFLYFAGLTVLL